MNRKISVNHFNPSDPPRNLFPFRSFHRVEAFIVVVWRGGLRGSGTNYLSTQEDTMKKFMILATAVGLLAAWPVVAAESHKHAEGEFCAKHCKAEKLGQEVNDLTKAIEATKASTKQPSGEKLTSWMKKKEDAQKKLDKQTAELEALKAELEKADAELSAMQK
jgi:hypothetical protein